MTKEISEITTLSRLQGNVEINYLKVADILSNELKINKFKSTAATTNLEKISAQLIQALEDYTDFKPMLETIGVLGHKPLFVEGNNYYWINPENGNLEEYNPFLGHGLPVVQHDIQCVQKPKWKFTAKEYARIAGAPMDYSFTSNPRLYYLVADFINVTLNEEQEWVKQHSSERPCALQPYLSLERVVINKAPELLDDYKALVADITSARTDSISSIIQKKSFTHEPPTIEEAFEIYRNKDSRYEQTALQDFWEKAPIKAAVRELNNILGSIVVGFFPAVRVVSETSLRKTKGYDVYHTSVTNDDFLTISYLGDYRILMWELK